MNDIKTRLIKELTEADAVIFTDDYSLPLFVCFYEKNEFFDDDTYCFTADGMDGMHDSLTADEINNSTIVYNDDDKSFTIEFEDKDEDRKRTIQLQFLYVK